MGMCTSTPLAQSTWKKNGSNAVVAAATIPGSLGKEAQHIVWSMCVHLVVWQKKYANLPTDYTHTSPGRYELGTVFTSDFGGRELRTTITELVFPTLVTFDTWSGWVILLNIR